MKQIAVILLAALLSAPYGISLYGQADDLDRNNTSNKTLLNDIEVGRGKPVQMSDKWIGILCRPTDEVLQTHLGLEQGVGLIVERVVPDSPADRANLKTNDILVQVNDEDLTSLQVLIDAAANADETGLTLRCIRGGERDIVKVVPETRPADIARFNPRGAVDNIPEMGRLRKWIEQLEQGAEGDAKGPMQFRFFGPGVPLPGNGFPRGLNIQIQRENDEPAKIKVEKEGTTWEVTEDSLDQLPDDVRATVQGMLQGGEGLRPLQGMEQFPWPQLDRRFDNMNDQMQEMDDRMQKMLDELRKLRQHDQQDDDSIDA